MSRAKRLAKEQELAAEQAAEYLRLRQALSTKPIPAALYAAFRRTMVFCNDPEAAHWVVDAYRGAA